MGAGGEALIRPGGSLPFVQGHTRVAEHTSRMDITPNLFATLKCRDARASITFLVEALGFTLAAVYPEDEAQPVAHAELRWHGGAGVMLGQKGQGADYLDDLGPSSTYLVHGDPDALFAQAVDAGAEVVQEPRTPDYGGRDFAVRHADGNVWSVGSYAGARAIAGRT